MELVDRLPDAGEFTKIDIHRVYGNLRGAKGNEEKLGFVFQAGHFQEFHWAQQEHPDPSSSSSMKSFLEG